MSEKRKHGGWKAPVSLEFWKAYLAAVKQGTDRTEFCKQQDITEIALQARLYAMKQQGVDLPRLKKFKAHADMAAQVRALMAEMLGEDELLQMLTGGDV